MPPPKTTIFSFFLFSFCFIPPFHNPFDLNIILQAYKQQNNASLQAIQGSLSKDKGDKSRKYSARRFPQLRASLPPP
jgi:hypothetical protein